MRVRAARHMTAAAAIAGCMALGTFAQAQTVRFFVSGHSLTDRPMPDMVAAMADQVGFRTEWNRQHIGGSTIRMRTVGEDASTPGSGYRAGEDRDGGPVDVLSSAEDYDIFIITERHRVLDVLIHEGMLEHLRDFAARVSGLNPDAETFFYAPWADVSDLAAPGPWIDFERRASPVWRCIVERANELDTGKRPIRFIPASEALADLVAALNRDDRQDEAGFAGLTAEEISALVFTDKVHLSDLGVYYVALITYGIVFGDLAAARSGKIAGSNIVSTAWISPDLDEVRARELRKIAASFIDDWNAKQPNSGACDTIPAGFIMDYTGYMQTAYGNEEVGVFRATIRRFRQTLSYLWALHGWGTNPLEDNSPS